MHVVTGAFGYTGRYITRRLLDRGLRVKTLTGHPDRPNPFGDEVAVAGYDFDRPDRLAASLAGAEALYNTYWVRFAHGKSTFAEAVENSRTLIRAAESAGVRRIVHVSIANPSLQSPLPYYHGKALVEEAVRGSKLSYAILRPTVIFGREDILINNIAWLLRRFPVFGIPGRGDYKLQPIFVEDMAGLAVDLAGGDQNVVLDAVGPDVFTFEELVRLIARAIGSRALVMHLPASLALFLSRIVGLWVGDVVLTSDEVAGLTANLLVSHLEPTGRTRLADWLAANAESVGASYASEIARHFR